MTTFSKKVKLFIWERDSGLCQFEVNGKKCLAPGADIDHIKPKQMGGKRPAWYHTAENGRILCRYHHDKRRILEKEQL